MLSRPGVERAILSLMLNNENAFNEVLNNNIEPKHFSILGHRVIFKAIVQLIYSENVEHLDSMLIYNSVTDEECKKSLDELNGLAYIDSLFNACLVNNIDVYIEQLKNVYKSRAIYEEMKDSIDKIENGIEIERVMNDFDHNVSQISIEEKNSTLYKIGSSARERMEERKSNPTDVYGYKVGWEKFDKVSQGMQDNDLVVVVGESKTGKSTLLTNWSNNLCISGLSGAYFDTEMTDEEFEDRLISLNSGVPFEEIRNGKCYEDTENGLASDKSQLIEMAIEKIESFNLYHEYMPDFTIDKVSSLGKYYKREYDIDFLVFDYIKLPNSDVKNLGSTKEYEMLGYFTTCLKDLAGTLRIPVITACQTNRSQLGSTEQDASCIQGSYRILQMASKLYFIRNKTEYELTNEGYRYGNQVLSVAYQRHGGGGTKINIQFDKPILRQREVS